MGVAKTGKSGAEVEIKLLVHSPAALKRLLSSLGFRRTSARHFESNHLFDFPDGRLRRSGRLLRLREEDGRWIAEVMELPGCMAYGKTRADALSKAKALALRVLADRMENGEPAPAGDELFSVA